MWPGRRESNVPGRAPEARGQPMTHAQIKWTRRLDLRQPLPGCNRSPDYLGHGVELVGSAGLEPANRRFTVAGLDRFGFDPHRNWYRSRDSNTEHRDSESRAFRQIGLERH